MLSKTELATIFHHVQFASKWYVAMGIRIDRKTQKLHVCSRQWDYRLFLVLAVYMTFYSGHRVWNASDSSLLLRLAYAAQLCTYSTALALHIAVAMRQHELVTLFNQLVHMHQQIKCKTVWKEREMVLTCIKWGFLSLVFGVGTPAFEALEFHYAYKMYGGPSAFVFVHLAMFLMYFNSAYVIVSQLQMLLVLQLSLVHDKLAGGSILEYKTLSIMTTIFNQVYGCVYAPTLQYMFSLLVMICIVGAIRLPGTDPTANGVRLGLLGIGIYYLGMLFYGANAATVFWTKSTAYIRERRRCSNSNSNLGASTQEQGLARKCEKLVTDSLAPIRFGVAGLYYMEKEARLTFLHFLCNGTLTLLITFKSVA